MKVIQTVIQSISSRVILRSAFLLFMSVYISVGYLSQYLDCYQANEIELSEEKELESEEKENKEKIEKDKFLNNFFSHGFLIQKRLRPLNGIYWNWNHVHQDIPTPPPKVIAT